MSRKTALWHGSTVHTRYLPFSHRFRYPVAMMGIDLSSVQNITQRSFWFGINTFAPFSLYEKDFGPRNGRSLENWAQDRFSGANISGVENIYFIFQPRILGYQFNPISLYFGFSSSGEMKGIIYEVHNTFGEAHSYVAATSGKGVETHSSAKTFHVSPFFDVSGQYEFRLQPLRDTLNLSIRKTDGEKADFRAQMTLVEKPANASSLAKWFFGFPISTLFTTLAIHFEALRLVLKGAKYRRRPETPQAVSTIALASSTRKKRGIST